MTTQRKLLLIAYIIVILILAFTAPACTPKLPDDGPKCDESQFHDARFEYLNKINKLKEDRDDLLLLMGATTGACFMKEYDGDPNIRYYKLGIVDGKVRTLKRSEAQTIDDMKSLSVWKESNEYQARYLIEFDRIDCKKVPK